EQVMARGHSDEEVFNPPPSMARAAADWATSAIRGLVRGTVGLAGQLGDIPQQITETGYDLGVPRPPEGGMRAYPGGTPFPTTQKLVDSVGGQGGDKNAVGKFMEGKRHTTDSNNVEALPKFAPGLVGGDG